eukprot:EC097281.1.p1 GENE.EC097281.1~~EC097281.1.p1  ORF type:complete len:151 (-),score=3.00 EC097281.1:79-531(-)
MFTITKRIAQLSYQLATLGVQLETNSLGVQEALKKIVVKIQTLFSSFNKNSEHTQNTTFIQLLVMILLVFTKATQFQSKFTAHKQKVDKLELHQSFIIINLKDQIYNPIKFKLQNLTSKFNSKRFRTFATTEKEKIVVIVVPVYSLQKSD